MKRAAIYARVSTARQAEADLSMPDQIARCRAYCEAKDWSVVQVYEEPGASALDEDRPVFQRMIDAAKAGTGGFDLAVVHSFSRFSRDSLHSELYIRTLRKHGVELISISQEVSADPMGEIVRRILNMLDELQSRENAKHTSRAMLANASQGFWNGARPPYGFSLEVAEMRGKKAKKRLIADPVEAAQVLEIFELAAGRRGFPMGVKAICMDINEQGIRRRGQAWMLGSLHKLLCDPVYVGNRVFNRFDSRGKRARPPSEWVTTAGPALVPIELFETVQAGLRKRRPTVTAPRLVNGPTLLAGIIRCEDCGAAMVVNTGKSGAYRYYACSTAMKKGKTECAGNRVRMDRLDTLVIDEFVSRILAPARLRVLVEGHLKRTNSEGAKRTVRLEVLRREASEVEKSFASLLGMVEKDLLDMDDPSLKPRLEALKARRAHIVGERRAVERSAQATPANLDDASLGRSDRPSPSACAVASPASGRPISVPLSRASVSTSRPSRSRARTAPSSAPPAPNFHRRGRSSQLCSEMASPRGFEPLFLP
jgi:site-specific DNA recombinase